MQLFKKTTKIDFMGMRKRFLVVSLVAISLSIAGTLIIGPKVGIDFMGGTEIQVKFQQNVTPGQVRSTLTGIGYPGAEVVSYGAGDSEYLIRLRAISPISDQQAETSRAAFEKAFSADKVSRFEFSPGGDRLTVEMSKEVEIDKLEQALADVGLRISKNVAVQPDASNPEKSSTGEEEEDTSETAKKCKNATCTWPLRDEFVYKVNLMGIADNVMDGLRGTDFGKDAVKMRSEWVGAKVGSQLRAQGTMAMVYSLLFIMLYIAIRFDLRFAPGAVVALIHDVIITLGIFTLVRAEVTLATIAALLTIIGYSLNDTIVVFDRIRENLSKIKERQLSQVINLSINQTLSRTVLTSLTTMIVVVAILVIGWKTSIRDFAFALAVGVLVGTYSSIFVASPVVVWLDSRFGKKRA